MNTNDVKTADEIADDAKEIGRSAADSAANFAQASKAAGADALHTIKGAAQDAGEDAKHLGRDAASAARGYAKDAKATGQDAVATARAYTRDAITKASAKLDNVKGQLQSARKQGEQYVAEQPMRATLMAAAGGALLTALFVSVMRNGRRY